MQIQDAEVLRRRKRRQKRIVAGQSREIFIRASSAERSRKVKTEKRPHIWEIGVGNNEEKSPIMLKIMC